MEKADLSLEKIYALWGIVLILWALYRGLVVLPEAVDELVVKPLIFVIPVVLFVLLWERKPLTSIGLSFTNFVRDLYIGIGFGVVFVVEAIATNFLKYGMLTLTTAVSLTTPVLTSYLLYSVSTAFCEELLLRGFLYTRLSAAYANQLKALVVSVVLGLVLYVPVIFTRFSFDAGTLGIFIMTSIVIAVTNTMIFTQTKTLTLPILIHTFWNMAVLLYL